jgi:uncharacterized protein (DUF2249 family)
MTTQAVNRPITSTDRVSDVLARDEKLVDVFVRHAPHFEKLRNRAMRKVMGRLVTVQDAARMAGVTVDTLLGDLNGALGASGTIPAPLPKAAPSATSAAATASPASHPADAEVVEVDVREELRAGKEPFAQIMSAVSALAEGNVLRLRAIFEPVPLFAVLAKRGFAHESVQHGDDDWSVWFWRTGADEEKRAAAPVTAATADLAPVIADFINESGMPIAWLDVRGLEPPEPLVRTLAALDALPDGHQLVHVNVRVPQLLLPMLAERGLACELDESHADRVLLRVWRPV